MNDKFDLLMAFPKYRRLVNRLKATNRDNKNLRKNLNEQFVKNNIQDIKIKDYKQLIKKLRKEIKELRKSETIRN